MKDLFTKRCQRPDHISLNSQKNQTYQYEEDDYNEPVEDSTGYEEPSYDQNYSEDDENQDYNDTDENTYSSLTV